MVQNGSIFYSDPIPRISRIDGSGVVRCVVWVVWVVYVCTNKRGLGGVFQISINGGGREARGVPTPLLSVCLIHW